MDIADVAQADDDAFADSEEEDGSESRLDDESEDIASLYSERTESTAQVSLSAAAVPRGAQKQDALVREVRRDNTDKKTEPSLTYVINTDGSFDHK